MGLYVCSFLVYAILGWIYEVIWEFKVGNGFVNRGFLHGCYLPIYGFGGLMLYFALKKLQDKKIKIFNINITPLLVFVSILVLVSTLEFATSWGMEKIYHKRWWDYSYDAFNIDGRVSLRNSTLLAIGGMFFLYVVQPILNKLLGKVEVKKLNIASVIICLIIGIDFISVILGY